MSRTLAVRAETWPLKGAFAISRSSKTASDVVVAEVTDGTITGRGECVPYPHYGESVGGVVAAIESLAAAVAGGLDRGGLLDSLPPGAARNALDCALWDLEAKAAGRRAWDLADLAAPDPVVTAKTLGIDTPEAMGAAAAALKKPGLIKIKLDDADVLGRVGAIHQAVPGARLIVDANEAWTVDLLAALGADLVELGVEMIEQPLPAGDDAALADVDHPVPICADESCHVVDDLPDLRGRYDMVNVKLDKSGGLTAGLSLARAAADAGFGVMVGCMIGTSLAMAPATLLSSFASVVDLDGPLLLAADRDHGLDFSGGKVHAPTPDLWG
jgi:L-alanine-DL-glutamate epimerase-like enolase superfamily enzyme